MRMQGNFGISMGRFLILLLAGTAAAWGQASAPDAQPAPAAGQPVAITLSEAIHRAQSSEATYAAAVGTGRTAALDRSIARAELLPSVRLYNQDIYSEPNGLYAEGGEGVTATQPKFVANDARPREYYAQGIVDETISMAGMAAVHRANAAAAQAAAQQEIARRGLVATVVSLFYGSIAADHKLTAAQQARQEAADFTKVAQEREQARESAHADVVKAQLQEQASIRGLQDAQLATEKARLELGVLLFPDPRTPYVLSATDAPTALASREDFDASAAKNNPDLKSALAALNASKADVLAARGAYLPEVRLNFTYGIDANEFAVNGPHTPSGLQARNLGYSTTATINLPIWDWLATEHKVKQSEIRREVAQVELTAAQRGLIAKLDETYSEAAIARDQLASLELSVNTAAESLRLTRLKYQAGEATVLEVVDAQSAYITAQNAREDGRVRYEAARANLQTLTGTM